jgi:peroxiredoxin
LHNTFKNKVHVVAVYGVISCGVDTEAATRKLIKDKEIEYPVVYDKVRTIFKRYGIRAAPIVFVINAKGRVEWSGKPRSGEMEKAVVKLLDK